MIVKLRMVMALIGLVCLAASSLWAQPGATPAAKQPDQRASAYFNFAMGHMYASLAANYGYRTDYVDKAIAHYRAALEADPGASFVSEELTDLYMQAGKLRDAVTEAEEILKRNPENLDARRTLGRIYARLIGDQQQNRINEQMLKKAIEQYEIVVGKDPKDTDSWLMLGRLYKVAQDSVNAERAYKKALELDSDNEFALSGLALVYTDLGDTGAALEMWRKLAERDPRPQHLRALAGAYEQTHDYKSAVATLRRALEMAPRDSELKASLAEGLLLTDQLDEALKLYEEMAAAEPSNPRILVRISQVYRQRRDLGKARAAQERARALDPDNLETRYNDVELLGAEGKPAEAIVKLKEILAAMARRSPGTEEGDRRAMLQERLGILYRAAEQYNEAVEAFRAVAALDADAGAKVSAQIVETLRQAREFDRALREAETGYQKYPGDRTLRMVRASLLADLGRTDEAAAATRQLLNGRNDRETYLALAQIYERGKRFREQAEALDAAEKLSEAPDDREAVYFLRGAMLERMKNLEASEREFRKVLAINPQNAGALNYLGYMLADRNLRLQEAHGLIVKALEIDPNNGAYLDSLGWACFRMGKLEDAETYLRRALERMGRDPIVHDHLGDVYLEMGRLKDAIAQWEVSLREWERTSKAENDPVEIAKVQKKLESARVRLAREAGAHK
jgi:tetratricopeptide (TPR) repeat protein